MSIRDFISRNNLRPGDAIELCCPVGIPKHYAVYLGWENNFPRFIGNLDSGVEIITNKKLAEFTKRYEVTDIERFRGTSAQRRSAIKRALQRLGEKAYNLVFNNCEHFKNWVLYGESKSNQVETIGTTALVSGFALLVVGEWCGNNNFKKAGKTILIILLIIILIAIFFSLRNNPEKE